MRVTRLMLAEIAGRPLNFLLCLVVVAVAGVLFIVGPTMLRGYAADTQRQLAAVQDDTDQALQAMQAETDTMLAELDKKTTRIMRDMGVNLRIVHRDTVMGDLYTDFAAVDFPEEYVQKLATAPQVEAIVHLIGTLQEKVKWNGRTVLLVGMFPMLTDSQKNASMQHMAEPVAPGTVVVGYELATGLSPEVIARGDKNLSGTLDAGDELDVLGRTFVVAQVRPEKGTVEDIQLVLDLHDAQKLVGKEGRIHQILALNCKCKGNRISVIRGELEGVLPDTKVTEQTDRASAREQQRDLVEAKRAEQLALLKANREQQLEIVRANREHGEQTLQSLLNVLLPLVVLVAAIIVGVVTWLNVRERRAEIGLLRALGKRSSQIAALLLLKAVVIGVLGGAVACGIGWLLPYGLSRFADRAWFEGLAVVRPATSLMVLTVCGAPLVTAMASYLPTLAAMTQDPARILTEN